MTPNPDGCCTGPCCDGKMNDSVFVNISMSDPPDCQCAQNESVEVTRSGERKWEGCKQVCNKEWCFILECSDENSREISLAVKCSGQLVASHDALTVECDPLEITFPIFDVTPSLCSEGDEEGCGEFNAIVTA